MLEHGVYVTQKPTSYATPSVAPTGIPYVVGASPLQLAMSPAPVGVPFLVTSFDEAVEAFGYSDDWDTFPLCEFMYSHFRLFACQPAFLCNVFNPEKMTTGVSLTEKAIEAHQVRLPIDALASSVEVRGEETGERLLLNVDYGVFSTETALVVEMLEGGALFDASVLWVGFAQSDPLLVGESDVAAAIGAVDLCMTLGSVVPDLLLAPKWSKNAAIAAMMAQKADGINGLFKGLALIDLDASEQGATSYRDAGALKNSLSLTDTRQVVCWPKVSLGGRQFHLSTQLAGVLATLDGKNGGMPSESPSNKALKCDSVVLDDGTPVFLSLVQANTLGANGILTGFKFLSGWTAWGNYTACHPLNNDVKDYFIAVNRMMAFVGNTLIQTFWRKLDSPMNRRLVDTIVDGCNIWLNGLVGAGVLLGGLVTFRADDNPTGDLMAGKIKFHVALAPAGPAQSIHFVVEYDASFVQAAFS